MPIFSKKIKLLKKKKNTIDHFYLKWLLLRVSNRVFTQKISIIVKDLEKKLLYGPDITNSRHLLAIAKKVYKSIAKL